MRITITAAVLAIVAALAPTAASAESSLRPDCAKRLIKSANHHRDIVIQRHGKRAPGRDIVRHGRVAPNQRVVKARCGQVRRYRNQLVQLRTVPRYPTLVRTAVDPARPPAGVQTPSVGAGSTLSAIAQCESGGNPSAVSPNGLYKGKYQFDTQTWQSVGGSGEPHHASEAEQDKRAAILYSQRGAQPWPVCGR